LIPQDLAYAVSPSGDNSALMALNQWVSDIDSSTGIKRSTTFRKMEDIAEDLNLDGVIYFVASGGNYAINSSLQLTPAECIQGLAIPGGCDNPFGKIYRLNITTVNPLADSTLELLMEGSFTTGVSYDNIAVSTNGKILVEEDPSEPGISQVVQVIPRGAYIWEFDPVMRTMTALLEVDQDSLVPSSVYGEWSHTGTVQAEIDSDGLGNPSYISAVMASDLANPGRNYLEAQLLLLVPQTNNYSAAAVGLEGNVFIEPSVTADGGVSENWRIAALVLGATLVIMAGGVAALLLYLHKKKLQTYTVL